MTPIPFSVNTWPTADPTDGIYTTLNRVLQDSSMNDTIGNDTSGDDSSSDDDDVNIRFFRYHGWFLWVSWGIIGMF
jgi:hypothetical protein